MGKKHKQKSEEDTFDEPDCHVKEDNSPTKKLKLSANLNNTDLKSPDEDGCDHRQKNNDESSDKKSKKHKQSSTGKKEVEAISATQNVSDKETYKKDSEIKGKGQSKKRKKGCTEVNTQTDYDFIKFHLDMVPPNVLGDALQDDSEQSEDEFTDIRSEKPPTKKLKKQSQDKVSADKMAKSVVSEDVASPETYSKIKEKMKHKKNKNKNKKEAKKKDTSDQPDRRQILREKLLARIDELKGKRNLTSDEVLEKKKLRRKQSKLKLKMKRKEEKNKGNTVKPNINGDIPDKKPAVTPVKDKMGKMVFSKFDFVDSGNKESAKSNLKGKDFKRLLEKVEKKKAKIEKLKETNPEAAKTEESKEAWKRVLMKAEGEKIKDDPFLLKKSLKKKEKIKDKKKQQWGERKSQTEHRMKQKQDKRTQNIQSRKKAKIDKKIKKSKKKGRMVPGF